MYKVRFAKPDFYIDVENRIRYCYLLYSQNTDVNTDVNIEATYYATHAPAHVIFSFRTSLKKKERNAAVIRKNYFYLHYATIRLEYMIKMNYKYHCAPVVPAVFAAAFLFISIHLRTRK